MAAPTEESQPPSRRTTLLAIAVVAIVVVAGGVGAYFLLFAPVPNQPPTADFTYTVEGFTVAFDASGSQDPEGRLAGFDWDFGDNVTDTGLAVQHAYAHAGSFNVTLEVFDDVGLRASRTKNVTVEGKPVAKFTVTRDFMTVQVDATASYALAGATIVSYAWVWNDTGTGSGVTASHTYATAGRYTIGLAVTDSRGATGTTTRLASVARTTVDTVMYDFFNVSFGEWWTLRGPTYGDVILNDRFPYISLYPWAGDSTMKEDLFIYSMYRMNVTARNLTAMTLQNPVMLPVFGDPSIMGGPVHVHWYMQYLDTPRQQALIARGFDVRGQYMDGFSNEFDYTLTMDYNSSRRLFNVSGDPAAWWAANTIPGSPDKKGVENRTWDWLVTQGTRTYDVWSAYQALYTVIQLDMNATVTQNPGGGNTTTVKILLVTWGQDILTARWFHWGTASYPNGIANGWSQQELGWWEDFTFDGTLYADHVDFTYDTAMAYQFVELALPGPDGQYGTPDDVPVWSWYTQLNDYLYAGGTNPKSEMEMYVDPVTHEPRTSLCTHPGNKFYGQQYTVDQLYWQWNLSAGETITMIFPKAPVIFHDPYRSRWDASGIPVLSNITAPVTLRRMNPANVGTWDEVSKTFSMAGPFAMGGTPPLYDGLPRIDLAPKR